MSYEQVPFGKVVRSMKNGLSPSTDGHYPGTVLTLSAITQGRFQVRHQKAATFGQIPRSDQLATSGMFLICLGNGNLDLVGSGVVVPPDVQGDVVFPDTIIGADLDEAKVHAAYLCHAWRAPSVRAQIEAGARTTNGTFKINQKVLESIRIALPPPLEQHRIAAILDEADALRRKRQEALALLDQLLQSIFIEMFGDPVTNPRGWPTEKLSKVISAVEPGWSSNSLDRPAVGDEWGVLKVSSVSTGWFLERENKAVDSPIFAMPPITPRRGDLIFSRANTRELVAATCLVVTDAPRRFLPDKLWRITVRAERANVEWLRYLLAHPGFRANLAKAATGSSGSMLNVSQEKLLDMVAPIPPLAIQQSFADFVWAIMAQRDRICAAICTADDLFSSLLHRAFTGDL